MQSELGNKRSPDSVLVAFIDIPIKPNLRTSEVRLLIGGAQVVRAVVSGSHVGTTSNNQGFNYYVTSPNSTISTYVDYVITARWK